MQLLVPILILVSMASIRCQPSATLSISPSTLVVQEVATYKFIISISGDGGSTLTIPAGSSIVINFPTEYTSVASLACPCSIVAWPVMSSAISCTLSYNILTITNAFAVDYTISMNAADDLVFTVSSITNPFAALTILNPFTGSFISNYIQLLSFSATANTFVTGVLTVAISASPATTSSRSTLTISITPKHSIPQSGCLQIILDKNYTNAAQTTYLISQVPLCLAITNASANLYCTYITTTNNIVVTVANIFTTASNSPFVFSLYPFNNPPTTQPYGTFTFQTLSQVTSGSPIDSSTNNKITGITPNSIQYPNLYLSNTLIGSAVEANISLTISNYLLATDTIYVTVPTQLSCSSVTTVSMGGTQAGGVIIINSTTFQFTSVTWNSPNPLNITISSLILPSYAANINSPFILYVMRSFFYVCQMNATFSITLSPGYMNGTLTSTNYQAGVLSNYTFSLSLQNAISNTSQIEFYFSPASFTIGPSITCISSSSTNCTIITNSNNNILVTSATIVTASNLAITFNGITNPSSIGSFTPVIVSTFILVSGSYYLLDSSNAFAYFTVTSRPMSYNDFSLSASSSKVYGLANYTFTIKNNNIVPSNSYYLVIFPSQITISSITCGTVCVSGVYNGSNGVQFQQLGPLPAATVSTFTAYNVINPISTQPTSSFSAYLYNSQNNLLEYLQSGATFQASIPSLLTISTSVTVLQNNYVGWFNLTYSPNYQISSTVALILVTPNSLSCPTCLSTSLNSTSTQMIFSNQVMVNNKFTLNLPNFTFFYSYEPISFQAAIMSNDLLFNYANGSFATTNQVPSYPSFAFAFTNYELQSSTDLLISNITSGTIAQRIALIQLTFGTDFNISLIDCTNSGFTCSVVDRMVQLRINNLGNFSSFSIKNLITSANSPSTSVAFATYSSTGYLIDQNSIIIWKAACSLPCKTCNSVTTQCLSCYTDQVLAQSRVLYFASNLTCVADCGDLYYRNYTTNVCLSCSSSCANCYNFSYCTSCPSNQYFLASNTSCFQACPTGYFQKSIYCIACTSSLNCYTCTNELTCATCYGRYLSQSQCLLTCPLLTTVPNSINYTCDACPANCSTCQLVSSTVVCLSCSNGLLDNGTCVQSCKNPGYVPNNLICSPCDANCLTCQGSPTFCLSCSNSSGFPYLLSNKCYNTCPNTYYNNNNFYLCMPCISPCETCLNYSSTSCITCLSSFTLLGTNCESTCPTTYYKNGAICSQCVPPCLTCSTLSFCFTCISNYTYFSSNYSCLSQCPQGYVIVNQTCMICSSNCLTCISVTYCSSCHNSSYLLNGYCYNPCPTGYYSDSNSSTCVACLYSCSSCSSVSFCIACTTGYYMQSNNTCISLCSSNQISISGLCQTCNSNCTSCQGSINNCTACISAYLFAPSKNSCYSVCPASLFYYPTNSTCLTSCPSSFYISTDSTTNVRTCISCPSYCTSCISGTQCGGCVSGTYSYTGLCYSSCPPIAPYPFNYICQSCNVVSCQTCSGSQCSLCSSTLLLIGGSLCITSCSSLQIYNSINKTCDTIVQNTTSPNSTSTTTTNSTSQPANITITTTSINNNSIITLNFIPMPFLIIFVIGAIIIFLLHLKVKLSAVPTLLGVIGPLISIDIVSIIIISYVTATLQSLISQIAIYFLIVALSMTLFLGFLCIKMRYQISQCEKPFIIILCVFHHNAIALLTANINSYNSYFIDQHKSFWRKYKLISKIGLIIFFPIFLSGIILGFTITDRSNYVFYSGIEICILAFLQLLLTLAWIWLPIQPPSPEAQSVHSISEQSTQQISDGHEQIHSSCVEHSEKVSQEKVSSKEVDSSMEKLNSDPTIKQLPNQQNKLRNAEIKSEGEQLQHKSQASVDKVRSSYEFNDISRVVKVQTEDIERAIEKGLFRKNEDEMLKEIKEEEEYSKIDDAQKLNDYMKKSSQDVINIFEDFAENDLYQDPPRKQSPKIILPKIEKQKSSSTKKQIVEDKPETIKPISNPSKSDGSSAIFDEPILAKQQDFYHNIIFEENEEDNKTFFEGDSEPDDKPRSPNIFELQPTPSLGSLIQKDTNKIKVNNLQSRIISPEFDSKRRDESVIVQDFEDSHHQSSFNIFATGNSRLKPMLSKQLSKLEPQKQMIHADFEQILTVSDGDTLKFIEDEDFIQHESSRKLSPNRRINQNIHDHDNHISRPSEILRQASIHYQPQMQKNQAPKNAQLPLPRLRSRISRNK